MTQNNITDETGTGLSMYSTDVLMGKDEVRNTIFDTVLQYLENHIKHILVSQGSFKDFSITE